MAEEKLIPEQNRENLETDQEFPGNFIECGTSVEPDFTADLQKTFGRENVGISILDTEFRIKWANNFIIRHYGSLSNLKDKYCYEAYRGRKVLCDDCLPFKCAKSKHIETGYRERVTPDGEKKIYHLIAAPIRDDFGNIIQILEISIDVTETKKLEQRLRESEGFYRTLFEHSGTAVMIIEEDKTLIKVNKKFEELYEASREEIEGKIHTDDLILDEEARKYHDLRRKDPVAAPDYYEMRMRDANNNEKLVDVFATMIPDSQKSMASLIDITEKRKLENKIRTREQQLAYILENSEDAIISFNNDYYVTSWNMGAENIFGYKKEEIIGEPYLRLFSMDSEEVMDRIIDQLREKGHLKNYEFLMLTKDKRELIVSTTWNLIKMEGSIVGCSAIIRDITENKMLMRQLIQTEKMSALGQLSANIAHEIKNPLNSMIINMEVMKNVANGLPEEHKEAREKITRYTAVLDSEIRRIDKVIRGFLDFAKPVRPEPQPLSVNTLINDVADLTKPELRKRNIEFIMELSNTIPEIYADESQVKQLILNILLNAIEAINFNGRIIVKTGLENNMLFFTINDNGPGIPHDIQDKIFDLFFTTKAKGSGQGLAIVKKILDQLGGNINFTSLLDEGTTFNIFLPIRKNGVSN